MGYYADEIRIVERCCAALERNVIESPLRRSDLPDELGKIVPVFVVVGAAAVRGKIVLVPPLELTLWRQRHPADFLAADQITAHVVYDNCAARLQRDHDPLSKRSTTWPEE